MERRGVSEVAIRHRTANGVLAGLGAAAGWNGENGKALTGIP